MSATNPSVDLAHRMDDENAAQVPEDRHDVPEPSEPPRDARPLIAVCGLQGGAGASTLAYLLARTRAAESDAPVLLCEAPGASGDQAALGVPTSTVSLAELAAAVERGRPPRRFWGREETLRVLATAPQPTPVVRGAVLGDVLQSASDEHAVTIVDVGDLRHPLSTPILRSATHVVWVLRLDVHAVERATELLTSRLVPALAARQAIAVRGARPRERFAGQGTVLRHLAAGHEAELILVPTLPVTEDGHPDTTSSRAARAATTLKRFTETPWRA